MYHNMVDNPSCSMPTGERLDRLKAYIDYWKTAHQKEYHDLEMNGTRYWDLRRGVLAQVQKKCTINCIQLASVVRQTGEQRWQIPDVGFRIAEFTMDPEQKLLVILEDTPG